MKYVPLIWRNLLRRKSRTLFTLLSVFVAFVLLGALMAVRGAFGDGVTVAGAERMVVLEKVSLINTLPIAYRDRIRGLDGVAEVTHANWFGGIYQDPKNFIASMAVDPETWLRVHSELIVPADQRKAWLSDRTGAMVGIDTARRFGWRIGDRIPMQGTVYRPADGRSWEFTIAAIYDARDKNADRTRFYVHYDYVNEAIAKAVYGHNEVSWYVIKVDDPKQSKQIASRLDRMFANSTWETRTATEKVFVSNFARKIGEVGAIIITVSTAVLLMILLVSGNTMMQAIRERTNEYAVLKAMGFSDGMLFALVLAESCVIAFAGGVLGLGLAWTAIPMIEDPTHGLLPAIHLRPGDVGVAIAIMAVLGVTSGVVPAVQARRLKIVEAMRRN